MPLNMNIINFFIQKNLISWCNAYAWDHTSKASCAVWAQCAECIGHFTIFNDETIRGKNEQSV